MKKLMTIILIACIGILVGTGCGTSKKSNKEKPKQKLLMEAPAPVQLQLFKISSYINTGTGLTVKKFNDAFPGLIFYNKSLIVLEKISGESEIKNNNGVNTIQDNFTKFRRIIQPNTSCKVDKIIDWDPSGLPKTVQFKFDNSDESFKLIFVLLADSSFKLKGNSSIKLADGTEFEVIARANTKSGQCALWERFDHKQSPNQDTKIAGGVIGLTNSSPVEKKESGEVKKEMGTEEEKEE